MKCVSSVSFTQENSSSYLQETAKASLRYHGQTWHTLYSVSAFDFTAQHIHVTSTFLYPTLNLGFQGHSPPP